MENSPILIHTLHHPLTPYVLTPILLSFHLNLLPRLTLPIPINTSLTLTTLRRRPIRFSLSSLRCFWVLGGLGCLGWGIGGSKGGGRVHSVAGALEDFGETLTAKERGVLARTCEEGGIVVICEGGECVAQCSA